MKRARVGASPVAKLPMMSDRRPKRVSQMSLLMAERVRSSHLLTMGKSTAMTARLESSVVEDMSPA